MDKFGRIFGIFFELALIQAYVLIKNPVSFIIGLFLMSIESLPCSAVSEVSSGSSSSNKLCKGDLSESKSKDEEDKTKADAVKEESNSGDIAAITVSNEGNKKPTEPEEEENELDDEEERSADSAIAKLEEGIAMSQLEEDALIKAIRETEQG